MTANANDVRQLVADVFCSESRIEPCSAGLVVPAMRYHPLTPNVGVPPGFVNNTQELAAYEQLPGFSVTVARLFA